MFKKKLRHIGWSLIALVPLTGIHAFAASDKTVGLRQTQEKESQTAKQRQMIIRKIIAETLAVDVKKVTANAHFVESLGGHSLILTELRFRFEDKFNLEISNDEAEKMQYVRDVFDFVEKRRSKK